MIRKKSTPEHKRLCREPSRPADFVPTEPPPRLGERRDSAPTPAPRNPAPRQHAAGA